MQGRSKILGPHTAAAWESWLLFFGFLALGGLLWGGELSEPV